jgi:hypothetical protein
LAGLTEIGEVTLVMTKASWCPRRHLFNGASTSRI